MNTGAGIGVMAPPVTEPAIGTLTLRVLSALILAPLVLAAVYGGSPYFEIMTAAAAAILLWELFRASAGAKNGSVWRSLGLVYIALACVALVWIRYATLSGRDNIIGLFLVVWASDIGAYAFGRIIGGPLLAPVLSPKKTWAGLFGAVVCAGGAGGAVGWIVGMDRLYPLVLIGGSLGAVAQGGDFLESWAKRCFGVKDSGDIIPGHGGLFDRVDGLLAAALCWAFILAVGNNGIYR